MEFALPHRTDVEKWNVEQVAAWLKDRNMPEAADVFLKRGIDGFQMLNLKEEMIIVWGRELRLRLRVDVMKLINQLRSLPSPPQRSKKNKHQSSPKSIVNASKSNSNNQIPKENLDEEAYLIPLSCKKPLFTKHSSNLNENKTIGIKTTNSMVETKKSNIPPKLPSVGPPVGKLKQPIANKKPAISTRPSQTTKSVSSPLKKDVSINSNSTKKTTMAFVEQEKRKQEFLSLGDAKKVPMTPLYKSLLHKQFFHPIVRSEATKILNKHGCFLIRPSTHTANPLTLSCFIRGEISHITIRQRKDGLFALGTPKADEKGFKSVEDLVEYHRTYYIQKDTGDTTLLLDTPSKKSLG